jgi:serine-type D-Ala-D-Ala carboxypeptidase (penicillin-binding protein 5/6)
MISSTSTKLFLSIFAVTLSVLSILSPAFAHGRRHHHVAAVRSRSGMGHRHYLRSGRHWRSASTGEEPATPGNLAPFLSGAYPHPRSQYVALIDVSSGNLLYSINPNTPREPASLTKIMAATILLENGRLSDTVVAPPQVAGVPESSLHLRPGERISLEDLLYAMLLRSANDTPVAGAVYLSGSIPKFVDLMNEKAQEIGCTHTHFVTPNGLYDPNHYSTAYDLALMARYAVINFPMFDQIVKTQRRRVHRSIDQNDTLVVNTASSFLKYFPGGDGIKTGYISQAGHCFVGSATRNGWRLIAVALDSPGCREDVMQMLSYGFAHFSPVVAVPQGTPEGTVRVPGFAASVPVATAHTLNEIVSKDHPAVSASTLTTSVAALPPADVAVPVRAGEIVGTLILYQAGKPVGTTELAATTNIATPAAAVTRGFSLGGLPALLGRMAGTIAVTVVGLILFALTVLKFYAGSLAKNSRRRGARLPA